MERSAAARRAAATKTKNKKLSAETRKRYEREAAAAEKKAVAAEAAAAEAKEGALGADAIEAASADAFGARSRATKAHARLTAASAPSERHAASCRLGKEAQINGTVKPAKPSLHDEEAHREAELVLPVEQVAAAEAVQAADGEDDELMAEACSTGGATGGAPGGARDALPRTSPRKGGGVHARQSQPGTPNQPAQRSRHGGIGGAVQLFE